MNCQDIERAILLAETDELPERKLRKLDEHLANCAACARYRDSARRLTASAREALPAGEPSSRVLARLRAAAAERPAGIVFLRLPVVQALASAAALAVLAGGWFLLSPGQPKAVAAAHEAKSALNDYRAIIHAVSETTPSVAEAKEALPREQDVRALAKELLLMEGLAEEEKAEPEVEETLPTSDEEPSPTALQWHSTDAYPPSVCG